MRKSLPLLLMALMSGLFCPVSGQLESVPYAPRTEELGVEGSQSQFVVLGPERTGVDYRHEIDLGHPEKRLYYNSMACGAVITGDVNQDGRTDLFITGGARPNRLYLNQGDLRFEDASTGTELEGANRWTNGGVLVDVDQDGDLDLYLCHYDAPNQLFLNRIRETGDLRWEESAARLGLAIQDASLLPAFADPDRDGDLDLYLLCHRMIRAGGRPADPEVLLRSSEEGEPVVTPEFERYYHVEKERDEQGRILYREKGRRDYFLRNDGGRFVDVTEEVGMSVADYHGNSAMWLDFDEDGWLDLFVGNDFLDPDFLYRNLGNGTFEEVSQEVLPRTTWYTMGTAELDVNRDGRLDFVAADMFPTTHYMQKASMGSMGALVEELMTVPGPRQIMYNALFVNTGKNRYREAAYLAGIAQTDWTWAVKSGDYDQDGFEDLFFANGAARIFNHADMAGMFAGNLVGQTRWDICEGAPERREQNLAYRSAGPWQFEEVTRDWGLDHVGMTYSCSQADLDNDGDLDLITASLDDPVQIYRNENLAGNHSIRVRLRGTRSNRQGIGARVTIRASGVTQVRTLRSAWGYLDADEAVLHFGLGGESRIEELEVLWPSGIRQQWQDLEANRIYTLTEEEEDREPGPKSGATSNAWFVEKDALQDFGRREVEFDDYSRQLLLPFKLSQMGPGQAWGDADGDGDDDLYLGGSAGRPGMLLIRRGERGEVPEFALSSQTALEMHRECEDQAAVFLDVDWDGDLDLFVASGSVEYLEGHEALRNRLYENDGKGNFQDASHRLPDFSESSSAVAAADFDRDGDVDLMVGTRSVVGQYPRPASSRILINESGTFVDGTESHCPQLLETGLVTSAVWSDVDGDGWIDLVVAHDWGPVKVFRNERGRLVWDESSGMEGILGWWNGVTAGDVDGDGDIDLVVTNLGSNSQYQASSDKPELMFYGDFDGTGRAHIVEANFKDGICCPRRGLSCSSQAMPFIWNRMGGRYHNFALSSLSQIYGIRLESALSLQATELRSGVFRNEGDGRFQFEPLPAEAQLAPGFGVVLEDFDLDGHLDSFLAQNFWNPQVETGPMMGGVGQLFRGSGSEAKDAAVLKPVSPAASGLVVTGDAKSLTRVDLDQDGRPDLVVGVNEEAPHCYFNRRADPARSLQLRLRGSRGNPLAYGARVEVRIPGLPLQVREVLGGSGFLSASASSLILAKPEDFAGDMSIRVRWPDGIISEQVEQARPGVGQRVDIAPPGN